MIVMMHMPELQKVLGLLKLSKYGKKSELMGRLLAVSHCLPKPVQNEIESLYRLNVSLIFVAPLLDYWMKGFHGCLEES